MKDYISKPEINLILSIVVPMVALGIAWGVMTTRINHIESMALGIQDQYKDQMITNEQIKISLARIETDILYIRKSLDYHISE